MPNLAELTLQITAQSSSFNAAISGIESRMQSFESKVLGHTNKVENSINKLGASSKAHFAGMESAINSLGGAFSNMLQIAGGISLANIFQSAVSGAVDLVKQGIENNAQLEESRNTIAALLQGTTDLTDKEGKKADATTSWRINLQEAAVLQTEIAAMSAKTLGTNQELQNVFAIALAYSRGQKANTEDILKFSMGMMNAGTLAGLKGDQIVKETRQILELNSMQGQQVLPQLGIPIGALRNAKAHQEQIHVLNQGLEVYNVLADQIADSWGGLVTTGQSFVSLFSAGAFGQAFIGAKDMVAGFALEMTRLREAQSARGQGLFSNELVAPQEGALMSSKDSLQLLGTVAADVYGAMIRNTATATVYVMDLAVATGHLITTMNASPLGDAFMDIYRAASAVGGLIISYLGPTIEAFIRNSIGMFTFFTASVKEGFSHLNPFDNTPFDTMAGPMAKSQAAMAAWTEAIKTMKTEMAGPAPGAYRPIRMEGVTFRATGEIAPDEWDVDNPLRSQPVKAMRAGLRYDKKVEDLIMGGFKYVSTPFSGEEFKRTGKPPPPEADKAAAAAKKQHDTAVKTLTEQVAGITDKNKSLSESITLNRSLAESEALAAAAQKGHKAGTEELTAELAKQNEFAKIQLEFLKQRDTIQKSLSESEAILPQQLAVLAQAEANNTPASIVQDQLAAIVDNAKSQAQAARFAAGGIPGENIAALTADELKVRSIKQQGDDAKEHEKNLVGLQTAQANELEQEMTRNAVLRDGIAVGRSYASTQREIADALEILKLEQEQRDKGKAGLTPEELDRARANLAEIHMIQDRNAALEEQSKLAGQISEDITSAFFAMSKNIGDAFNIMRDMVLKVIDDISQSIIRQQVTDPLAAQINQVLSGVTGTGGKPGTSQSGGLMGNLMGLAGPLLGGLFGGGGAGSMPGLSLAPLSGGAMPNVNDMTFSLLNTLGGGGAAGGAEGGGIFSWLTGGLKSIFGGLFSGGAGGAGGGGIMSMLSGAGGGIMSLFSSLGGGISSLFGGLFGGAAAAGGGIISTLTSLLPFLFLHSGGIVGSGGSMGRVSPSVFAGAPRFHSGLYPGEMAAILKKGEGVFTPDQMKAMGGRGNTIIQNIQTPDLGSFNRASHQLALDQRQHQEVSNRRFA